MIRSTLFASLLATSVAVPALAQSSTPFADGSLSAQAVSDSLGLRQAALVQVSLAGTPGGPTRVQFEYEGADQLLELYPHSVRADGFRLIEQRAGGEYVDVASQAPVTYRGEAPTMPGVQVAASWLEDGMHARILLPGGESLWLEPLEGRVAGASYFDYALYRDADVVGQDGHVCGVGPDEPHRHPLAQPPFGGAAKGQSQTIGGSPLLPAMGGFKVAELGVDTDFEYFQDYGSTNATQNQIESVINSMNAQYESEVGITHAITTIIVRTTSNDPYTTSSPSTFLSQFRSHWQSQQQSIQRDVAHLFTGKNLTSSTIGIAYLSGLCGSFGYGLVQSDCCGSFASKTDLSAHELGHNWSANHCSCTGFTMNAFLTSANKFNPSATIPGIVAFSNQLGCLGTGPGTGGSICESDAFGVGASAANIGNLFSSSDPEIGNEWIASFNGFNGFSNGLLIVALNQASLPFGDGTVLIDYTNPATTIPVSTFFGAGAGVISLPDNPALVGQQAFAQVGILDGQFAGGFAFSNGLAVTLCD
ncbi:M12 family metallo-peptidase [Engelhardtia mirabilis]|uniref:Reprolysin (M12B) family zinc metalloprotease n=1 Tax=Engelhardtia mirabilis TaxID=2528011 RepID=A0A518BE64_9BACT|nr:Reprolysin (M12B) family zinc metalloprotease [Planctomycetes bacterium Pla133]QDU99603.1 Reprolysin (M12B) family zinc metalloprotease [Planctomycetes bacterium Pla86]